MLYIVATPIGNLEDITFRAVATLQKVALIAAEDTRHTQILLGRYQIRKPLVSFFEHNKIKRTPELIELLKKGKDIALVTDSGTPGISDPGFYLIREAIGQDIPLTLIPGATAAIAGLVLSGLPTDSFVFEGFLPAKSVARKNRLAALKDERRTMVFYESPHRLLKTLGDIGEVLGERRASISRELTKKFEETKRGTVSEVRAYFEGRAVRGEFVIVIAGKEKTK